MPFILASFLPVKPYWASTCLLPNTLQHSILSLPLRATQVGVSHTCLKTISSTHVHDIVICRSRVRFHFGLPAIFVPCVFPWLSTSRRRIAWQLAVIKKIVKRKSVDDSASIARPSREPKWRPSQIYLCKTADARPITHNASS